jgi:diaminohydroxyphosphoribosylaminopyrimidine deaminase/5-amino-6-(5-phosphoribosylamino)uracil reductase
VEAPEDDGACMGLALAASGTDAARLRAYPNPWVGALLVAADGKAVIGTTHPRGGPHAEADALAQAERHGLDLAGGTAYATLEPCAHTGRTAPCSEALVAAGVARVVVAVLDPDRRTAGEGVTRMRAAGITVDVGVGERDAERVLGPYLRHRRAGTPFVTVKSAVTLDGRTAAPDGSSVWITGPEARADAHRLRAAHDAIVVGAGTVRADDPSLTVRDAEGPDPIRVVLGRAPDDAKVHPCIELEGDPVDILATLAGKGIGSVLVEGGATTAAAFHRAGLVDRWVVYVAPALLGGDDGRPLLDGPGAPTMADVTRWRLLGARIIGGDVRLDVEAPETGGNA